MKIRLSEYNEDWKKLYQEEADFLKAIFKEEIVRFEHFGSTSVPGLKAKPVIDMIAIVKDIRQIDSFNDTMTALGYDVAGDWGIPGRRLFRKGGENRTHHIHFYQTDNPQIERHLIVRDYLRKHPEEVVRYGRFKEELAERFERTNEYSPAKKTFVAELERLALEWHAGVIERFKQAVNGNDPEAVGRLLNNHPLLSSRIDEPWFAFDTPAIVSAASRGDRKMVDELLKHGADINAKSDWWAGGFGVLHHDHHDLSRYLIERGANVDPHAAAALGMLDTLRTMVKEQPDIVNQRGPDGQVPLHFAGSREIIDFLLDHGADIDRRDLDHNGTPAQYAVNNKDKCRHLVQRGARTDLFMACKLGDVELVRRMLEEDPNCLQVQVGEGGFTAPGGHIYEYTIGRAARPLYLAAQLGHDAMVELMLSHSSVEQRLLLACMRADRGTADRLIKKYPGIVQSLSPEEQSILADAAWNHRTDAVRLMLELGFHVDARRVESSATALHLAAAQGDDNIVCLLIEHGASVEVLHEFGGAPLNSCVWGSLHIRNPNGDYAAVAERLIQAGATLPDLAGGSEEVKRVLLQHGATGE
ncbi:MAG: Ankyrin [Paenibacillus sp.]|jgi:GrpB-like predicted nucleotidyltransferase (UPF0157 family)/ankyrin repeat protein|nr:Ankyrin [Paenibacillus sp.]